MNQKPFRTMILWIIWAATALVVYLTLYRDTDVWDFIVQDPSRITWLILGLFILALIASFLLTLLITQEAIRTTHLDSMAQEGGLNAVQVSSLRRAADRFFFAIKSTLDSRGQPEVETLLNVELAGYERVSHTVELIGNLLITLGLIGTVMGLTLTLTGLTGSLDALGHDQEMLLAGLRQAMGGMGTAFYTTLLGAILGGILLRMFAQISQHGIEGLHDNLLRLCMVHCSADYNQSLDRDVRHLNAEIKALEENIEHLQQAFTNSKIVVKELGEEIRQFNAKEGESGEPMHIAVKRHREYCEVLREEIRMLHALQKPWWARLVALFRRR